MDYYQGIVADYLRADRGVSPGRADCLVSKVALKELLAKLNT
jgi:hypothetical protein